MGTAVLPLRPDVSVSVKAKGVQLEASDMREKLQEREEIAKGGSDDLTTWFQF